MSQSNIKVFLLPARDHEVYYSDQLDVLFESENMQVSLFTDNIAVIHKYTAGDFEQQEIVLTGSRQENTEYLRKKLIEGY